MPSESWKPRSRRAQTPCLIPVSARKQLFDLSDEMATRVNVQFYSDTSDALLKGTTRMSGGMSLRTYTGYELLVPVSQTGYGGEQPGPLNVVTVLTP